MAYAFFILVLVPGSFVGAITGITLAKIIARTGGTLFYSLSGAISIPGVVIVLRELNGLTEEPPGYDLVLGVLAVVGAILFIPGGNLVISEIRKKIDIDEWIIRITSYLLGGAIGGGSGVLGGVDLLGLKIGDNAALFVVGGGIAGAIIATAIWRSDEAASKRWASDIETARVNAIETAEALTPPSCLNVSVADFADLPKLDAPAGYLLVSRGKKDWNTYRHYFEVIEKPSSYLSVSNSNRPVYNGNMVVALLKSSNASALDRYLRKKLARNERRGEWYYLNDSDVEKIVSM